MGGHSSGPSSYEIQERMKNAEEAEKKRVAQERAKEVADANKLASGGTTSGGEGSGVLSAVKRKKGSTLAGEGAQTFGVNGSLGA